jgi:hypothetical protein
MKTIPLTRGKVAIVDDDDFVILNKWKWCAKFNKKANRYDAVRRNPSNGKNIFMHRQIMGLVPYDGLVVDHKNHDTLDYRRDNLRVCTQAQNCCNKSKIKTASSKFIGVSIARRGGYTFWRATIKDGKKLKSLGYTQYTPDGERLAALKYNEAARQIFGQYANLNLI